MSGPSGVGKGTVLRLVREEIPELRLTVSATTREPRPGDVADVSYHFMSDEEFDELEKRGAFLEWAVVHGHRYGTLAEEVDAYLGAGDSVVLEIDVQGGLSVRAKRPDAVLIFIEPPSMEELERRLRARATEDEKTIRLRLANARTELELGKQYDEHVVNDDLEEAVRSVVALIDRYEINGGVDTDGNHEA